MSRVVHVGGGASGLSSKPFVANTGVLDFLFYHCCGLVATPSMLVEQQ